MYLLGIETSCDETAVSIVEDGQKIHSNLVFSQVKDHAFFSGVVPEIASRKHLECINLVLQKAFLEANLSYDQISAVGVVYKPGLIGSLLVGLSTAKAFAFQKNIPLIPVNHLEAHLYAPHLENEIPFPNLGLVASGGHTLLFQSSSPIHHKIIGSTVDDAVGECFDKVAKYFDLGYPGGPIIDAQAKNANPLAFHFPKPCFKNSNKNYSWSYSGLKSAVIHQRSQFINSKESQDLNNIPNILASFQKTAIDMLLKVSLKACVNFGIDTLVVAGGVACNSYLRKTFSNSPVRTFFASPLLSTDNAAMVAGIAYHLLKQKITADFTLSAFPKIKKKIV